MTGHVQRFTAPSCNAIVLNDNGPRYSPRVYGLTVVSGLHWGRGINGRALARVTIGGLIYTLRVTHGDCPPHSCVYEIHWGRGINLCTLSGSDIGGFVSVLRSSHGDSNPH